MYMNPNKLLLIRHAIKKHERIIVTVAQFSRSGRVGRINIEKKKHCRLNLISPFFLLKLVLCISISSFDTNVLDNTLLPYILMLSFWIFFFTDYNDGSGKMACWLQIKQIGYGVDRVSDKSSETITILYFLSLISSVCGCRYDIVAAVTELFLFQPTVAMCVSFFSCLSHEIYSILRLVPVEKLTQC